MMIENSKRAETLTGKIASAHLDVMTTCSKMMSVKKHEIIKNASGTTTSVTVQLKIPLSLFMYWAIRFRMELYMQELWRTRTIT